MAVASRSAVMVTLVRVRLPVEEARPFLDRAGWTVDRLLTAAELRREYLAWTPLPELGDVSAFIALTIR